jgi:hypothetical protein
MNAAPTITQYLEQMTTAFPTMPLALEKFVLASGRAYAPHPLPKSIKRGEIKQCFENAAKLAFANPKLTYVEGYGLSIIPVHHAWCVDGKGRVVDPTWDEKDEYEREYFGVPIGTYVLRKEIVKHKCWGVFVIDYWRINIEFMKAYKKELEAA